MRIAVAPAAHSGCMTLEQELEATLAAAGRLARDGERAVAVMATEPQSGARVYVVAFAAGDDLATWRSTTAGAPVTDRRLVKDAVSLAALAERAEEVSGATAADELVERFGEAAAVLRRVGDKDAAAAADGRGRRGAQPGRRRRRPAAGDAAVPRPDGRARGRARRGAGRVRRTTPSGCPRRAPARSAPSPRRARSR